MVIFFFFRKKEKNLQSYFGKTYNWFNFTHTDTIEMAGYSTGHNYQIGMTQNQWLLVFNEHTLDYKKLQIHCIAEIQEDTSM